MQSRQPIRAPLAVGLAVMLLMAACSGAESASSAPEAASNEPSSPPETAAPVFVDGDTLTIIVPTAPGGGFDTQARLLEPYLEAALLEVTGVQVEVVVENVPEPSHRAGTEQVFAAAPDGKTILYTAAATAAGWQVGADAEFDLTEMTALGQFAPGSRGWVVRSEVGVSTFEELVERSHQEPILLGYTGTAADIAMIVGPLREAGVDLELDLVPFDGTSEVVGAYLRGDVEAVQSTSSSLVDMVTDNPELGDFLMVLTCERDPSIPDVPTLTELDVPGAEEICLVAGGSLRTWLGPPDMPAHVVDTLAAALELAATDPEHVAQVETAGFNPAWSGPADTAADLSQMVSTFEQYRSEFEDEFN